MFKKFCLSLVKCEKGVTAIEYGLLSAVVGIAVLVAIGAGGSAIEATFQSPASAMDQAALANSGGSSGSENGNGGGNSGNESGGNAGNGNGNGNGGGNGNGNGNGNGGGNGNSNG